MALTQTDLDTLQSALEAKTVVYETYQSLGLDASQPLNNGRDGGFAVGLIEVTGSSDVTNAVTQERQ